MMGSQLLDMLRQGVWASLTGGWYYDPHHKLFTNTFHLYVWLSLFCLPLSFHLYFTTFEWYTWLVYSLLIFIFFATIKLVNRLLHHLFDTGEVIEEELSSNDVASPDKRSSKTGTTGPGSVPPAETIGLQDMRGAGARASTPPVSSSSRTSVCDQDPASDTRLVHRAGGRRLERPSSTFDLKVDVHHQLPGGGSVEVTTGPQSSGQGGREDSDVVILVDESPGQRPHHEATRELVLEESKLSKSDRTAESYFRKRETTPETKEVSQCTDPDPSQSCSTVTTSSQLTVSCPQRPGQSDNQRRFSNLSNLAQSLPSDSRAELAPITGSLDLAAILDPSYTDTARQRTSRGSQGGPGVRRTKSAMVTGPAQGGQAVASHPVSLDAGMDRGETGTRSKIRSSAEMSEVKEVAEEVSSKEAELDTEKRVFKGSDMDLFTYQEQLEEATKALLKAGQYLESETKNKKYILPSSASDQNYSVAQSLDDSDPKGSGPYMPMVGKVQAIPQDVQEGIVNNPGHNETGTSLLSSVGLDWLFSDSEPDQPQETRMLRSRSESPKSSSAMIPTEVSRESRDSSHGSSGTDTETRALLDKLECVENILEQSSGGGAIPKRRPVSRPCRSGGQRSGSLDGGRHRAQSELEANRSVRRRQPTLDVDEDYSMPATNTLYDDAAGLKLFLDILNGPDGHNKEAEAELRKLIDKRRNRMHDDSRRKHADESLGQDADLEEMESRSRKKRLARRRRHNAQTEREQMAEVAMKRQASDKGSGENRDTDGGIRKRERKSRRQRENVPHIAADHDDTTTGAVHCFKDEFGNWQTYTFGGDSLAASAVAVGALANLLTKETDEAGVHQEEARRGGQGESEPAMGGAGSSRSSVSADSSLTVILDSPAMVFQPGGERTRSVESGSVAARSQDGLRSRDSGSGAVPLYCSQHWSRENSVPDYRLYTTGHTHASAQAPGFRRYNNALQMFAENFFDRTRPGVGTTSAAEMSFSTSFGASAAVLNRLDESNLTAQLNLSSGVGAQLNVPSHLAAITAVPKVRKYHLLSVPGFKTGVKVWLDRLQLLNILDQDKNVMVTVSAVLLSVLVCVLGSLVLQTGSYRDLYMILFCAVQASCHYSLLKSVQPDASSPTHGFNPITVFSRPIYFIICCVIILILDSAINIQVNGFQIYGHRIWFTVKDLRVCRDFIISFILAFPIIFTVGLLPQINTALMYVLETIDIHIFGGNASSSLQASAYCVIRSLLAVVIMFGFAYGGLTESSHSEHAQQVLFSIFCSLAVVISYHLSRASGDPTVMLSLMKRHVMAVLSEETASGHNDVSNTNSSAQSPMDEPATPQDPLPKKLRDTVNARLKNDAIVCSTAAILVFLVHQSDVFVQAFPTLDLVLWGITITVGFLLHYLLPHLRKQTPWKCFAAPILAPFEQTLFEVREAARVMWWEKVLLWSSTLERSVLYPLIFLSAVTHDREVFTQLFGTWGGSLVMTVTLTKSLRCVWSDSSKQYFTLLLCILLFQFDPAQTSLRNIQSSEARTSPFLLDYFLTTIITHKLVELYLKCQFVITYIAPHQINWGSAFHAFAQPFSVPHSAMLFLQAILSSILSSPLNPLLGSTIFICSYVRPVKFWERNYNTKRTDHSNTRLASQFEVRNPGADDNNLNSIFYEHLTRSLQHSLAGDLMLGRWGSVQQGDCFVLASDNLNCLVHIIELGNGLCTFQVRGLEFRGTYCQQREVEAISEGVEEDEGCCCCDPGHLPHMLSVNAAFGQRWLAWEVSAVKYVLEGYSISDNSAQSMLQVWDLRKVLILYYIKSIIYYTVRSPKLTEWLENADILAAIRKTCDKNFDDVDPIFNANIDEDYDFRCKAITRNSFCNVYLSWIQHCCQARDRNIQSGKDSDIVSLCLCLSLLGRRALGAASNNSLTSVEFFLIGLHALFKGDFRITHQRDEWVFLDMELLRRVVAPAVRMSLKLHQDHFMSPDEYEENSVLYEAISSHEQSLVISHEGDPAWRHAVLSGAQSLLALRHVVDDGTDEYKIIMLNKRHLSFRVIKLNRECVRGLWAGQQQELIFLRNRNPERGSIQNAKQALRNIINSSCDQPIGYPIYVSPLTTSFCDTNSQVTGVIGGPLSLKKIKTALLSCWLEVRERCAAACTSSSSADCEHGALDAVVTDRSGSLAPGVTGSLGNRCSVVSSVSKPSSGTLVSLAGLLGPGPGATAPAVSSLESVQQMARGGRRARTVSGDNSPLPGLARAAAARRPQVARILDPLQVYDNMNLGRRIDPYWPDPEWRARGGRNAWAAWIPLENMEGPVVHRWTPCHRDPFNRSHTDKTILLLKIGERFVPIAEQAVLILPDDRSKKSSKDESVGEKNKDMPRSQSDSEEPVWTKVDLGSVDSSKSLAGIPSISEKEETEMVDMLELRASTLDREDKEAGAQ